MIYGFFYYILGIILLEVLFLDVICIQLKRSTYLILFNFTFIILGLIAAFRYGVGADTPNYMEAFNYIPKIEKIRMLDFTRFRFAFLYVIFCSLSKSIYNDFLVVQLFQCLFLFGSLYLVLKEFRIRRFYILLLLYLFFYLTEGMSAMRECLAISICFVALIFYNKNKFVLYAFFTFLAMGFHTGAFVFFILPLMKSLGKKGNKGFYLFLTTIVITILLSKSYLNSFRLLLMFGDNSVARYLDKPINEWSFTNIIRNLIIITAIKYWLIDDKSFKRNDYAFLAVFGCLLDMLAGGLPIVYRSATYFQFFIYYSLYCLLRRDVIKNHVLKYLMVFLIYYQPASRFFSLMNTDTLNPYCSVFSPDKSYYDKKIKNATASDYLL